MAANDSLPSAHLQGFRCNYDNGMDQSGLPLNHCQVHGVAGGNNNVHGLNLQQRLKMQQILAQLPDKVQRLCDARKT